MAKSRAALSAPVWPPEMIVLITMNVSILRHRTNQQKLEENSYGKGTQCGISWGCASIGRGGRVAECGGLLNRNAQIHKTPDFTQHFDRHLFKWIPTKAWSGTEVQEKVPRSSRKCHPAVISAGQVCANGGKSQYPRTSAAMPNPAQDRALALEPATANPNAAQSKIAAQGNISHIG